MHGFAEQIVDEYSSDDHDIEQHNEHDHYEGEPCELTGLLALTMWLLRDGRRLHGVHGIKLWILHGVLTLQKMPTRD